MPNPRETLSGDQDARIVIRAPSALLKEIKETAEARGTTQSHVIRVAVHLLHLADSYDATFDADAVRMMADPDQAETLASLRRDYLREANELVAELMPRLSAVLQERFLETVLAEASGR